METFKSDNQFNVVIDHNNYNEKCAEAIRTLKLFIRNAEEQHETKIPITTLNLIIGAIEEPEDII